MSPVSSPSISVSVSNVLWPMWLAVGIMILLQLIILVVIAGRPSAVAVMGVTLPFLCGVCALVATFLILGHIDQTMSSQEASVDPNQIHKFGNHPHYLVPLLYAIWGICGIVALVTVVLSMVSLKRGPRLPASSDPATAAPRRAEVLPEQRIEPPSSSPEAKANS